MLHLEEYLKPWCVLWLPLCPSSQSSWLQNGDVLCFLWGTNWIYICYVEESRPPLWSNGQSSWLQIQKFGFDSRRYQIFWEVVGLERGPLSLVSTTEELLGRKSRIAEILDVGTCRIVEPSRCSFVAYVAIVCYQRAYPPQCWALLGYGSLESGRWLQEFRINTLSHSWRIHLERSWVRNDSIIIYKRIGLLPIGFSYQYIYIYYAF
jgi:hypothetical protein